MAGRGALSRTLRGRIGPVPEKAASISHRATGSHASGVTASLRWKGRSMSRTSKADARVSPDEPEIEGRYAELDGYTVGFETHKADMDPASYFRGLPDDRCQCPHWGVVLSGKVKFTEADGETTIEAGEAYYIPPGHLPYLYEGTEVIEFSPTKQLQETLAVVEKNMAQSG